MENVSRKEQEKQSSNAGKIIAIVAGAVVLVGGLVAGGIYLATHQEQTTIISSSDSNASFTLVDGKNKITKGGTYTFTGSTPNGKIEVETAEDVKIILNGVSITNSSGAAIKSKGTGKLTIELVGDNTLVTTDNTADDPAAAISGDADLEITGTGSATVKANGKGIKADGNLTLGSATLNVTSTDDTIHSNSNITIASGTYTLNTGDDAIHSDGNLIVSDGKIVIEKSHEGIESNIIEISGGDISVTASDDAINAQNSDGSSRIGVSGDGALNISGGKLYVNSGGDGLDSNGKISISGGEIYVDGPVNDGNGAIDCDGEISITGGTLIAVGSSGMAQNATSATQPSVLVNLSQSYSGELSFGGITYTPSKKYQSVLISSSSLKKGETYELKINGSTIQSVSISDNITGQGSSMMGGGMPGGGTMGSQNQNQRQTQSQATGTQQVRR
ncbi:carbohydrate-binding domain-containing protein [Candidatus Saccharibacteria bacterium]|nr:carbohydrate-binding domain-containing protein [Candidatus Saccharibacteria bacterium]